MQFTHATLIAALLATTAAASPIHQKRDCYDGPYVIYARGTSTTAVGTGPVEDPTDPGLENIAQFGVPGATVSALSYPASGIVNVADYGVSWGIGIDNLQNEIRGYADSCPGHKIVLLGYSQGASVITGSLMGGQGRAKLAQNYLDAIAGGVAIADPSFVPGLSPLDDGSTNTNMAGGIPDGSVQTDLNAALGSKFRSLCSEGDQWCANANPYGGDIHGGAEGTWTWAAAYFLQRLEY